MGEPVSARTGVGIVGCGAISGQYLTTLAASQDLELVAVADLDPARAGAVADAHPGVRALTVPELVAHDDVDVVLNLTIPAAHAEVAHRAVAHGKDVYLEKPLTATTAEARDLLAAASARGVRVGCAPDTVLGTGIQTARRALDEGLVGRPLSATATMMVPGHEHWHPDPDFYYAPGGGPLLDMGPYYLTSLVTLLGPVTSVTGTSSRSRATRTIASGPRRGESVRVTTDTHVTGVLTHGSGALATVVLSFDAVATAASSIEIHGDTGSLIVPDPNRFAGDVRLFRLGGQAWETLEPSGGYRDAGRGCGLADMARTPRTEEHRASGSLAYHVLDVMESLLESARTGAAVTVTSTCARPVAVPLG
ncbi:Gfo/Idh/MocA family protein [Streptomyces sp. NPDC058576]|uniref:Gfo/Idh/MocA family protein n=1 Tax=Streptomyces sp. NPDC058576 TaxID=3346547 RepID=UPI0036546E39